MARMLESLNLTPGQWGQVRGLARERLEKMAGLSAQRMKLQIELAGLRWNQEVNPQQVKAPSDRIAELRSKLDRKHDEYLTQCRQEFGDRGWACPGGGRWGY